MTHQARHSFPVLALVALAATFPVSTECWALQATIDATVLPLQTDTFEIWLARPTDTVRVGTVWDGMEVRELNGRQVLVRVYKTENRLFGPYLDTAITTWPDLRPIRHRIVSEINPVDVEYHADTVYGWVGDAAGGLRHYGRRVTDTLYSGSSFDLIVRSAAWSEGDETVSALSLLPGQDTVAILTARLAGRTRVRRASGKLVEVWRIEMDVAGLSSTLWVSPSDRRLVRQVIRLSPEAAMIMVGY